MVKGRIAVLTAQSDEAYQRDFLMGVEKCAFESGYDVCIFSMYCLSFLYLCKLS